MTDLNYVALVGRLGRDVEEPVGTGPLRFSLAVNRRVKKGDEWIDETSWIDCEHWHRSLLPYLLKGKQICVWGELKQDKWFDQGKLETRTKTLVVVAGIQLLGGKEGQGEARPRQDAEDHPPPRRDAPKAQQSRPAPIQKKLEEVTHSRYVETEDGFGDDVPF